MGGKDGSHSESKGDWVDHKDANTIFFFFLSWEFRQVLSKGKYHHAEYRNSERQGIGPKRVMTQENSLGLHDLLAGSAHYSHLLRKLIVSVTKDTSCLNDVLTAVTKCPGKKLKQEGFTLLWSSWGLQSILDSRPGGSAGSWLVTLYPHSGSRERRGKRSQALRPHYSSSSKIPQPFPDSTTS